MNALTILTTLVVVFGGIGFIIWFLEKIGLNGGSFYPEDSPASYIPVQVNPIVFMSDEEIYMQLDKVKKEVFKTDSEAHFWIASHFPKVTSPEEGRVLNEMILECLESKKDRTWYFVHRRKHKPTTRSVETAP